MTKPWFRQRCSPGGRERDVKMTGAQGRMLGQTRSSVTLGDLKLQACLDTTRNPAFRSKSVTTMAVKHVGARPWVWAASVWPAWLSPSPRPLCSHTQPHTASEPSPRVSGAVTSWKWW